MYINKRKQQELINQMTNWQRTQWARAGYKVDKEELEKYVSMTKTNQALTELQRLGQEFDNAV